MSPQTFWASQSAVKMYGVWFIDIIGAKKKESSLWVGESGSCRSQKNGASQLGEKVHCPLVRCKWQQNGIIIDWSEMNVTEYSIGSMYTCHINVHLYQWICKMIWRVPNISQMFFIDTGWFFFFEANDCEQSFQSNSIRHRFRSIQWLVIFSMFPKIKRIEKLLCYIDYKWMNEFIACLPNIRNVICAQCIVDWVQERGACARFFHIISGCDKQAYDTALSSY